MDTALIIALFALYDHVHQMATNGLRHKFLGPIATGALQITMHLPHMHLDYMNTRLEILHASLACLCSFARNDTLNSWALQL